jgi:hypothetical protein
MTPPPIPGLAGAGGSADADGNDVAILARTQLLDRLHEEVVPAVEGLGKEVEEGIRTLDRGMDAERKRRRGRGFTT